MLTVVLTAVGCSHSWRPPKSTMEAEPPPEQLDVVAYLKAGTEGRWMYQRRSVSSLGGDQPAPRYERVATSCILSEGALAGCRFPVIGSYVRQVATRPASQPAPVPLPPEFTRRRIALLCELTDPAPFIPADLHPSEPASVTTGFRLYTREGNLFAEGRLTRKAVIENVEDVEGPAGRFEKCLRVRVDVTCWFPWGWLIEWTSYVWLSKELGEVKRVERLAAWIWIFHFYGAYEYELTSWEIRLPRSTAESWTPPAWRGGALVLEPGRIDGLYVEFAPAQVK